MLQKYVSVPFRLYGYLTGIDRSHYNKFDVVLNAEGLGHADKLDALASEILKVAGDQDWIVFIDGDAFPINFLDNALARHLDKAPLVAIQRLENLGEKHAHPSFCATTVGFWKEIKGSWQKGYQWINALNLAETDVGGELLRALTRENVDWIPLRRTNRQDIIPVCYGIYGDLIYHHGAGFRGKEIRAILHAHGAFQINRRWDARILNNVTPSKYLKRMRNSFLHPEGRLKRKIHKLMIKTDAEIVHRLFEDPEGFISALRLGDNILSK